MLNVRAKKNHDMPEVGVALFIFDQNDETASVRPVKFVLEEPQDGGIALTAQKVMSDAEAVRLMDDLWGAGVRPTEGAENLSGVIEAKDRHISDLREIVRCLLPKTTQ